MNFQKGFDELLAGILADYQNQFPGADVSQGSLIFIKSACLASALWGLYRHQDWIARQIFPDTADSQYLEHHAWRKRLTRKPGESDDQLLERLLQVLRNPPAGGTKADYETWAKEVTNVKEAWCLPLRRGTGTVDVVILADAAATGSEIPSPALLAEVLAHIETKRPVGMAAVDPVLVLAPTILLQDVTMTLAGSVVSAVVGGDIEAYLRTFIPGQSLYQARIEAIGINNGADDAAVSVPAATVTPALTEMIRPGVINVS